MKLIIYLFIFLNFCIFTYMSAEIYLTSISSDTGIVELYENVPTGTFQRIENSYNLEGTKTTITTTLTLMDKHNYYYSIQKIQDETYGQFQVIVTGSYFYSKENHTIHVKTKRVDFDKLKNDEYYEQIVLNNPQSPIIKQLTKAMFGDYELYTEGVFSVLNLNYYFCYADFKFNSIRCFKDI